MNQNIFIELWRLAKGTLYFRFSVIICYLGASFIVPVLWEVIVYLLVEIFNLMYTQQLEATGLWQHTPDTNDYIIGCIMIIVGIAIFVIFHLKKMKMDETRGSGSIDTLSILWQGARDLNDPPDEVHQIDLINGINLINETGVLLENASKETLNKFTEIRGGDFKKLFNKLFNNKYELGKKTSDALLNLQSKKLYKLI